jgi:hypothetical protein
VAQIEALTLPPVVTICKQDLPFVPSRAGGHGDDLGRACHEQRGEGDAAVPHAAPTQSRAR